MSVDGHIMISYSVLALGKTISKSDLCVSVSGMMAPWTFPSTITCHKPCCKYAFFTNPISTRVDVVPLLLSSHFYMLSHKRWNHSAKRNDT